jgi:hypothetical protein
MRRVGACFAITALSAVIFSPPPAAAFGLRIGPFHIGMPILGHRRFAYHPLYMRANPNDLARPRSAQGATSALLYPSLALSAIFQNIFWPAYSSAWPFGYQDIFSTAFARAPPGQDPRLCRQPDNANLIVGRIRDEVAPTADQLQLLQKLGGALGAASGYLAKSCPKQIPAQPTARLQLMGSQIEELTMAVDIIRQPLQDFGQSLNDEQKARLAVMIEAPAAAERENQSDTVARSSGGSPTAIDRSIEQIDQSVQPTDAQRDALADARQAFGEAASDLEAHCSTSMPPTAFGRLETIQARLDSTWRAVLSIQVALANFETKLSDEQKDRFEAMNFAAR